MRDPASSSALKRQTSIVRPRSTHCDGSPLVFHIA